MKPGEDKDYRDAYEGEESKGNGLWNDPGFVAATIVGAVGGFALVGLIIWVAWEVIS